MSKANQKFVQADEAVSPVIGVILMVAITVVLAAVVFVLVSNLSKTSGGAPNVAAILVDQDDRIRIDRADADAEWEHFQIRSFHPGAQTVFYDVDGAAGTTDEAISTQATYENFATADGAIEAGDFIEFCVSGLLAAESVQIVINHEETNTVIFDRTFTNIAAC